MVFYFEGRRMDRRPPAFLRPKGNLDVTLMWPWKSSARSCCTIRAESSLQIMSTTLCLWPTSPPEQFVNTVGCPRNNIRHSEVYE